MSFLEPLLDLLLPSNCAECKRAPTVYCQDCLSRHSAHAFERAGPAPQFKSISGLALSFLDERVSGAVHAFKEQNQFAIAQSMIDTLLPDNPFGDIDLIVAVPSSAASFKKRGFVPAELVAARIAKRWALSRVVTALRFTRAVEDQAGLSIELRQANLIDSMIASSRLRGKRVLLVDDVVTTGATILESVRAVEAVGARVVGCVALVETPKRIEPSRHAALSQFGHQPSPKID